jgi:aryl carrier-like protein
VTAEAAATPERRVQPASTIPPLRAQLSASQRERTEQLFQHLRETVAQVLGCAPDSLSRDMNLLDSALDSLRVMELLSDLSQSLGVALSPVELFLARPTLAGFAADLAVKVTPGETTEIERVSR